MLAVHFKYGSCGQGSVPKWWRGEGAESQVWACRWQLWLFALCCQTHTCAWEADKGLG